MNLVSFIDPIKSTKKKTKILTKSPQGHPHPLLILTKIHLLLLQLYLTTPKAIVSCNQYTQTRLKRCHENH